MSPRRAAIFLVLALLLFAALRPLAPETPAEPADSGPTLFLGGFRAIAADVLWVRLLERDEAEDYEAVVSSAEALLALDPHFEQAWAFLAWTIAVNRPALEPESERWPWVRQGLLVLREGARENPGSWTLAFEEGTLAWQHVAPDPTLAARFRVDRTANPDGLEPRELARRRFEQAHALPGHAIYVDWKLIRASIDAGRLARAREVLAHVRAEHPRASPDQLADFEREIDGRR